MDFYKKTALGFFDSSQKTYIIPVYQRAYSWEKDQWNIFINDILEQIEGNNSYFFGTILLEAIKKDSEYEIIDGQQRLTTLSIFIRAILNVLDQRDLSIFENVDLKSRESIFLKNAGNIKLRPVEYDRACYDSIIIENNDKFNSNSPSQNRIIAAKKHFQFELDKLSTSSIIKILSKIETTELTVIELAGKKDSALIFELENNRGKDLTNMERIKSYFMYQMYVYSNPEETEINIEYIANIYKSIYLTINDLKSLSEDSILIYHNNAYIKGFAYRTLDDLKEIFKKEKNKIQWIKEYISELYTTFANIKQFEFLQETYSGKLKLLSIPAFIYPFIIKGYKYFGDDSKKLSILFQILEIVTFRTKLINSRANIYERLNSILLNFKGDLIILNSNIKDKLNEEWYWGDSNMKNYLNGNMYGNNVLNYLLWEYENSLQNKGYSIKQFRLENEQIEHISPRKPTNLSELIASGYDVNDKNEYVENFEAEYLHCVGNLMLISGSHNSSIGNICFTDKLTSYNSNPLLNQQAEIKDFCSNIEWKKDNIDSRHDKIIKFSIKRWSFPVLEIM